MELGEDFKLVNTYTLDKWDKKQIALATSQPPVKEDWSNDCLDGFKKRYKKAMEKPQNRRCAYCRTKINTGNSYFDIEHIEPRSLHPEWMFLPENLCLACRRCNSAKKDAEVLENPASVNYPTSSNEFKIINPYLDNYFEHIELIGGFIYRGKTPKGVFTINTCNLSRYELAESRAEEILTHGQSKWNDIINHIITNMLLVDDFRKLLDDIKGIVETYKLKTNDLQWLS